MTDMERNDSFKFHADLINKYLVGTLSLTEQQEFELWLNQSQANRDLVDSFKDTKKIQSAMVTIDAFDANEAWKNVAPLLEPKKVSIFSAPNIWKSVAAVLVISAGLGMYLSTNHTTIVPTKNITANITAGKKNAAFQLANGEVLNLDNKAIEVKSSAITAKNGTLYLANTANVAGNNILTTPKAGEYKMVLPDGTNVWLNAASSLRFANSFNKNERKVYLKGEAYFEVAHNTKMPFKVNFNQTEVEVLGTHFNINTYETASKTTLLQGSVKISEKGTQKLLKPGEEAMVTPEGIKVTKVVAAKTIAWTEGLFLFEEENMADILDQVARWYDVEIKYDGKPNAKKYSGNIRRQADLTQVLEMLTTVSGNKFTLTDRTITVKF